MAVVIRLKRIGRRLRPFYRISAADRRNAATGRTLENLGTYDPLSRDTETQHRVDVERARHWLRNGALASDTVRSIFRLHGVYEEGVCEDVTLKARPAREGRERDTATKRARAERKKGQAERKQARREARKQATAVAAQSADASEE